jgi:hypothetical protein
MIGGGEGLPARIRQILEAGSSGVADGVEGRPENRRGIFFIFSLNLKQILNLTRI